jgi:hypothetical protein
LDQAVSKEDEGRAPEWNIVWWLIDYTSAAAAVYLRGNRVSNSYSMPLKKGAPNMFSLAAWCVPLFSNVFSVLAQAVFPLEIRILSWCWFSILAVTNLPC